MANKWEANPRLKTARSPSSVNNQQHHDKSLSERDINGSPGTIGKIISNANTLQSVPELSVLRVTNTTASTQFLFIGEEADAPAGAPVLAEGFALPPNSVENFYVGQLLSKKSVHIKASDAGVQVVVAEL